MRANAPLAIALLAAAPAVLAQSSQSVQGNAPLTTNNAQSACVQFGDCTTAQGATLTISQFSPVTAPPSMTIPVPTDPAQVPAYEASLASAGAAAAYSSRMANGMNTADAGATTMPTGTVVPQAPGAANSAAISQNAGHNAAAPSLAQSGWRMWAISPAIAVIGAAAGAAFVL